MKRRDLIKALEKMGCILVRNGVEINGVKSMGSDSIDF